MATRRLRWQGTSRTAACREALLERTRRWLADWGRAEAAIDLVVASPAAVAAPTWRSLGRDGSRAWVGLPADGVEELGATLVGLPANDGNALAAGLGARALDDLLQHWLPSSSVMPTTTAAPTNDECESRYGGLVFTGTGVLAGLVVVLGRAVCDALVPLSPRAARPPLAQPRSVLGETQVAFYVELSFGDVALAEASALRVGEVLLAGALGDIDVSLRARDGAALISGALARAGDCRGIRVMARNESKGTTR